MRVYDDSKDFVDIAAAPLCVTVIVHRGAAYAETPTGVDVEVILDYYAGRRRAAEKLWAYRSQGDRWRTTGKGGEWKNDSGDVLERFLIELDPENPGVYI